MSDKLQKKPDPPNFSYIRQRTNKRGWRNYFDELSTRIWAGTGACPYGGYGKYGDIVIG